MRKEGSYVNLYIIGAGLGIALLFFNFAPKENQEPLNENY